MRRCWLGGWPIVYSKDEILTLYLNEIYYGNLAYGVEAAAQAYFGKSVRELDLAECAFLAGLPQSPSAYDPFDDPEAAEQRQAVVLDLMVKAGFVDPRRSRVAKQEQLYFAAAPFPIQRAPLRHVRAPLAGRRVRHWRRCTGAAWGSTRPWTSI